jgi:hypothetical protein
VEANRELDVRIAEEVMGLRPCHFLVEGIFSGWATIWRCRCATTHKCFPENQSAIDHSYSPLRKYTEQLEAAWEVLVHESSRFVFTRQLSSRGGEDFRLCRDYPECKNYWLEYMTPGGIHRGPNAPTPALAICLAALDAVKIKNGPPRLVS